MRYLVLICFFYSCINFLQAQPQCKKMINDLKIKLKNDRPQDFNLAIEISREFTTNWMLSGCDRNSDEFIIIYNELMNYVESIRNGERAFNFNFSFIDPPVDVSNLWFNNFSDYTEIDLEKYIYQDDINVRIAPTTDSPIITSLPIGKKVMVKELTNEKYSINNTEYPWIKISFYHNSTFLEGYVVAKFIAEESFLVNDHLFLLAPQYNYEQQYQIKSVKDNREVDKINLSNTNGYDEGGSNFKIIQNNLNDVEIFHIFWCYPVCGRACVDEYVFWNGKKFYNPSSDKKINLSYGWKFDDSKTKILYYNDFFFYNGNKEIYYDEIDMADGDYPQDKDDFDGNIYTEIISELIWTGQKLKKIITKNELLKNLEKKSGRWYLNNELYSGYIIEKWPNGKIKSKKTIKNGYENGPQFEFFENEKIRCITNWSNGKWNGLKTWYLESGIKDEVKEYLDWKVVKVIDNGSMHLDDSHNHLSSENDEYSIEKVDTMYDLDTEEEEVVDEVIDFDVVESSPIYPGCKPSKKSNISDRKDEDKKCLNNGITKHIKKNFAYPFEAKKMGIQEKIYVTFVIDKTGVVSDVRVARGEDKHLCEEAIRLVKSIPKMTPANQRGKPVAVNYTIPINFMLN